MATSDKNGGKKTITITFDGDREFHYVAGQTVGDLLNEAVGAFGVTVNPHTMALFTQVGTELLNLGESVKAAGLKAGDVLILRPSAVRGG
jgi:hypothetical protein